MAEFTRRKVIAGLGVAAGAAAVVPLLGAPAATAAGSTDPDALLKAGRFAEAARGYQEVLQKDPNNAHATRQYGYIALLSNRFADAEKYLSQAVRLAPDDKKAKTWLADCYLRQDKYSAAGPLLRAVGREPEAIWYEAVKGQPYQVSVGGSGRVPWTSLDPLPTFEASVNGLPPATFGWDTGDNLGVGLSVEMAKKAGLQAVSQIKIDGGDAQGVDMFLGVLPSFKMGDVELRNIPVSWADLQQGGGPNSGELGAQVFAHFVSTLDWANTQFIFRPRTTAQSRAVRAEAAKAECAPLPMWIDDNLPYTLGSINGSGSQVVCINIGMEDGVAGSIPLDAAKRLGVRTDTTRPMYGPTHGQIWKNYPCYPSESRIGPAIAREIYWNAPETFQISTDQFDVLAAFAHTFFKPYALTLDYAGMNVYITDGKPTS